ncbi:uncharacterized protein LOC135806006 [Sycon ciliatum]|uniref:uncharacterized protein LOC135806006 n=1 Tax=Sycon ciliatum TaxID=27933 RepID=UPI0020AEA058
MKLVVILALCIAKGAMSAPAVAKRGLTESETTEVLKQMEVDANKAVENDADSDGISSLFDELNFEFSETVNKMEHNNDQAVLSMTNLDANLDDDDSIINFINDHANNGNGDQPVDETGHPDLMSEEELAKIAFGEDESESLAAAGLDAESLVDETATDGETDASTRRRRSAQEAADEDAAEMLADLQLDNNDETQDIEGDGISTLFDENFDVGKMAAAEMDHNVEEAVFSSDANFDDTDSIMDFVNDHANNGNMEMTEFMKGQDQVESELGPSEEELAKIAYGEIDDEEAKLANGEHDLNAAEQAVVNGEEETAAAANAVDANQAEEDNSDDISYLDELQTSTEDDSQAKAEVHAVRAAKPAAAHAEATSSDHEELMQLREAMNSAVDDAEETDNTAEEKNLLSIGMEEAQEKNAAMDSNLDRLLELQELNSRK